ncbi:TolC family protein [Myroides injenensis]|uniref:TolC family protein n=1 Tax=Myroides injenensis TaxID=1183151 RepID=UPI0002893022|nr:TolC family protein [Myroides injenensis]
MVKDLKGYLAVLGSTIAFFCAVDNTYGQELSFAEAHSVMSGDNSLIKAVKKQEEVHEFKWKSAKGYRFPSIKAYGIGLYFDRKVGSNLNDFRDNVSGFFHIPNPEVLGNWDLTFMKREIAAGGLMVTWPLFTGGKINAAIKAGEIESEIGKKDLEKTENKLISELADRYFQTKLAEKAVEVRKEVLKGMERHLYDATKLEENGIIAPVEKLQADVAVSQANRELASALKDATLARVALANTLEKEEVNDELTTDFFIIPQLESLSYYQESAVKNYPELQKVALQKQLADQGIKAKKSSYYPNIVAFGQGILVHNEPVGFGLMESKDKPWVVGVGLTYTLFEGMRNKNEIRAAKATKESVEFMEKKAQKDIKTLVEKIYKDIQKQEEEITNLGVQEKLATELLRVRKLAFSEGFASSTDVVDAEMNLSGIKLLTLKAHYQYSVDLATLLEYAGLSNEFIEYTK